MKKILSLAVVMIVGLTITFAQSADTGSTSTSTSDVQKASPAVKVSEVNGSSVKCSTGNSCCKGGSKAAAVTTTSDTDTPSADVKTEAEKSSHTVTMGTSATNPVNATVEDPED